MSRAKHSLVYHSMSRGGCQGEWRGKSEEAREGEQKRVGAKAVREAREAREGGGWRGGIGIKKVS